MRLPHNGLVGTSTCWLLLLLDSPVATALSKSTTTRSTPPLMVACASTTELERAIQHYVRPEESDAALEIGSQFSSSSALLCELCQHVTLVDFPSNFASSGRSKHQHRNDFGYGSGTDATYKAKCVTLQDFSQWRTHLMHEESLSTCQILLLDVAAMTGNDLALTALTTATEMSYAAHAARVILIKSKALSSLARRLIPVQSAHDGSATLPSNDDGSIERSSQPIILTAVGVQDYRRAIPLVVQPGDVCLEVGCHAGKTTALLHDAAACNNSNDRDDRCCLGLDISPKIVNLARQTYPHVKFAVGDAWQTLKILKLQQQQLNDDGSNVNNMGFDVIFADIGGLSGQHGLLESLALVDALAKGLEPRIICIKSLCLQRLANRRLQTFTRVWEKEKQRASSRARK